MALTPSQILFGRVAGIIGVLQGIAWAGLSLAAIIVYYTGTIDNTFTTTTVEYTRFISLYIQAAYLDRTNPDNTNRIVRSKDFIIFMWIYFFISIIWAAVSASQLLSIHFNDRRQSKMMVLWGGVTLAISLIDIVFTALLLRDFVNCATGTVITVQELLCHNIIGILMTLAARGFALWLINVMISVLQIFTAIKIMTHEKVRTAIRDVSIPRAKMPSNQTNSVEYPRYPYSNGNQTPSTVSYNQYTPSSNEQPAFMRNGYDNPAFRKNENRFVY